MRIILVYIILLAGCALGAQPVYNIHLQYADFQTTLHYIYPMDSFSLVIGLKADMFLDSTGFADNRVVCYKISLEGEIINENTLMFYDNHRIGIEPTGYCSVRIGNKIYFAFTLEDEFFSNTFHYIIYCIDLDGNLLFHQESDLLGDDQIIYGMNKTIDNQLVLVGRINYSTSDQALKMIKMDTMGSVIWHKDIKYQELYWISGFCVAQMPNGDFIISGDTYVGNPPDGDWQMYYARTDSMGNVLWEHDLGVEGVWDNPAWFELREDGGFNLFGGYNQEPYFAKIDGDGNILLEKFYSFEGISASRFPIRYQDKYHFLISQFNAVVKNYLWVVDSNFNTISNHQIGWEANTSNQVQDIKLSSDCALVMCGYRNGNAGQSGLLLKTTLEGFNCGYPDCYDEYINEYADCMSTSIGNGIALEETGVMISPNPVSDRFAIILEDQSIKPKGIKIFTSDGRQVMKMDYREEVLVGSLRAGLYFVEIVGDGFSHYAKIVVSY